MKGDMNPRERFEKEWGEIEPEIETMARKLFLPGWTLDDFMQEFRIEAYRAAQWWDPTKAKFSSFVWHLILKRRSDLVVKYNTQGRAQWKEDKFRYVDTAASSAHGEEDSGTPSSAVVLADDFNQAVREQIGNAGRYAQIYMLESVGKIEKMVIILLAEDFGIAECVQWMRDHVDPDFDHKRFYRIRNKLQSNPEVQALIA